MYTYTLNLIKESIHCDKMEETRFVIEAAEVESIAKSSGLTVLQLLPALVKAAQKLARPPISKYHVGAVGLGSDGRVFLAGNIEFPGVPLNQSIHAEQFLVTNAAINSEQQLQYIAVSSAPCGHCRQFMQELFAAEEIKIFITSPENGAGDYDLKDVIFKPISHFLPHRFGPDDLLDKDVPLILEPHQNGLVFHKDREFTTNVGVKCNGSTEFDAISRRKDLRIVALEAANESHAPYSGCPSGVALMDSDGKVYKGSYMESAAYNPSLGPVQAALVAYIAAGGGNYNRIKAAVLVEMEEAVVRQEGTARLLLQSISPHCDFNVFSCIAASRT